MPILREWRAEIRRDKKAAYMDYILETGITVYKATPGNLGAAVAIRDLDVQRSEIVTLSWWTSFDAIREFAGQQIEKARYFTADDEYLLTRPEHVVHYEMAELR